jgi:hypothetical protein
MNDLARYQFGNLERRESALQVLLLVLSKISRSLRAEWRNPYDQNFPFSNRCVGPVPRQCLILGSRAADVGFCCPPILSFIARLCFLSRVRGN